MPLACLISGLGLPFFCFLGFFFWWGGGSFKPSYDDGSFTRHAPYENIDAFVLNLIRQMLTRS
jgi:hypothetical protein